jgi:hypothetical protein
MADASIVMYGAKQIIEDLAKKVGTKIVLTPPPVPVKTTSKKNVKSQAPTFAETMVQPNTPKEEQENEEDMERRLLGGKTQKEINAEKGIVEVQETVEMDDDEIKPCKICGKPPTAICGSCNDMFCNEHLNHGCDMEDIIPTKDKVVEVTKKIKTLFMEEKDPNIIEDGQVQKYLDKGMSEIKITRMLINEYQKTGRNENLRIYSDLQKKNAKKHSKETDIKLGAMLTTLNNQVN